MGVSFIYMHGEEKKKELRQTDSMSSQFSRFGGRNVSRIRDPVWLGQPTGSDRLDPMNNREGGTTEWKDE